MIGYDRQTPTMRARVPSVEHMRFVMRTDSDLAQLAAREPDLRRVLADAVELKLGIWIVMHEDLRSTPRCRAVFDALVAVTGVTASPA